ncbi:hypothetical protein NONO_c37630 [Nocardia nova SH22a]|uniref:Uncharacterized protein n=1 Tax=Nocardia nova SH22a TaxID=1415166 RepID=W5TH70_9NOCA|nr:hypothetical protein [Nocardia nova]AHH18547.1 hypothetical protein NONO_c37630 [Nocardia nova SH22a]
MSDSTDKSKSRLKTVLEAATVLTGITTLVINSILTVKAIHISEDNRSLSETQYNNQQILQYSVNVISWDNVQSAPPGRSAIAPIKVALQNTGARPLQGCRTLHEFVKQDLSPDIYWPSNADPEALVWTLKGGDNHESAIQAPLPDAQTRTRVLMEVWYECDNPRLITVSNFFDIDILTGTVQYAQSQTRPTPIDAWQRYQQFERDNGRTPAPRPTP